MDGITTPNSGSQGWTEQGKLHAQRSIARQMLRSECVKIYMLHRVENPSWGIVGHSLDEIRYAVNYFRRKGYDIVSLKDVLERMDGRGKPLTKAVVFTLDDGFIDQATLVAPLFIDLNCPLTMFVITGFLDGQLWPWDARVRYVFLASKSQHIDVVIGGQRQTYAMPSFHDRLRCMRDFRDKCKSVPEKEMTQALDRLAKAAGVVIPETPPPEYAPMSWNQCRELEQAGIIFAPHTVSHGILSKMSAERQRYEIMESWRRVEAELNQPLPVFNFPTGRACDYDNNVISILKDIGLKAAVTTEPGTLKLERVVCNSKERYRLNRISLPGRPSELMQQQWWLWEQKEALSNQMHRLGGKRAIFRHYCNMLKDICGVYQQYHDIDWKQVTRLIFVCTGNICRSPYAEARARVYSLIEVLSFGLEAKSGAKADPDAIHGAMQRGIDLAGHRSKGPKDILTGRGDLLIGMEPDHGAAVKKIAKEVGAQITLLGLWAEESTPCIQDPYGKSDNYFQQCFDMIDSAVEGVLKQCYSSRPTADK